MRRRLFQIAATASFALCIAVHIFWLRSHFCSDKVVWAGRSGWRSVRTAAGHFELSLHVSDWSTHPAKTFHGPKYERDEVRPPYFHMWDLCSSVDDIDIDWQGAGFAWNAKLNLVQGDHYSTTVVPCWLLAAATLVLPLVATAQRLRSRRQP